MSTQTHAGAYSRNSSAKNAKSILTNRNFAIAYFRLSREEAQKGESSSISNQKKIVEAYCQQNNIALLQYFVDDGWSGGNFERPGFQDMMRFLESGKANKIGRAHV